MSSASLLLAVLLLPVTSALLALIADTNPSAMRAWCFRCLVWVVFGVFLGLHTLLNGNTETFIYQLGLPWLHWHLRLDPLAGFFLALIGIVVVAISFFGPGLYS